MKCTQLYMVTTVAKSTVCCVNVFPVSHRLYDTIDIYTRILLFFFFLSFYGSKQMTEGVFALSSCSPITMSHRNFLLSLLAVYALALFTLLNNRVYVYTRSPLLLLRKGLSFARVVLKKDLLKVSYIHVYCMLYGVQGKKTTTKGVRNFSSIRFYT